MTFSNIFQLSFFALLIATSTLSCTHTQRKGNNVALGNFYNPRYATGFCIDSLNGMKVLQILTAFEQKKIVRHSYHLDKKACRIICLSTTHIAMLKGIEHEDKIVGVTNAKLVYDSIFVASCSSGKVVDIGSDGILNIEKICSLQPDLILAYDIAGELSGTMQKLAELKIPVMYIGEYSEKHPLGKVEWIVALAALFGSEDKSIAIFNEIEKAYTNVKKLATQANENAKVLLNAPWSNAWFLPGQQSYMNTFLLDAKGESVVPLVNQSESYPFDLEYIFGFGRQADVWLNPGQAQSVKELDAMHPLIPKMQNCTKTRIYNNNKRMNINGGNDFFESGVINPHLILKDLIAILHPTLLPNHSLVYYQQLK
ncbi:MAG: ABC transporter substrate-binding protein [Bacteroidales bacterium]